MCWSTTKKEYAMPKKAEHNKIVYKVLRKDGKSPYNRYAYAINHLECYNPITIHALPDESSYTIEEGYHSFASLDSHYVRLSIAAMKEYCYHNLIETQIYYAYIPKGTIYYQNEDNEVVSENIVITDKVYSENFWYGFWKNIITRIKLKIQLKNVKGRFFEHVCPMP